MSTIALLYPIPIGERSIAMNMSVCLSLCPIAFIGNDMTRIGQMSPLLGPLLAALR